MVDNIQDPAKKRLECVWCSMLQNLKAAFYLRSSPSCCRWTHLEWEKAHRVSIFGGLFPKGSTTCKHCWQVLKESSAQRVSKGSKVHFPAWSFSQLDCRQLYDGAVSMLSVSISTCCHQGWPVRWCPAIVDQFALSFGSLCLSLRFKMSKFCLRCTRAAIHTQIIHLAYLGQNYILKV